MKIETNKIPTEPVFMPFTVSFTIETEEEYNQILLSLRKDGIAGDADYKLSEIPGYINNRAKIYYAFKCKGNK